MDPDEKVADRDADCSRSTRVERNRLRVLFAVDAHPCAGVIAVPLICVIDMLFAHNTAIRLAPFKALSAVAGAHGAF